KGWTQRSLNAFASSSCPDNVISQGDIISASFDLFSPSTVEAATRIFVRVTELRRDQMVGQPFEQQYEHQPNQNLVVLGSDFPVGTYELAFGFYLESELGQEFPAYYAQRCTFRIL